MVEYECERVQVLTCASVGGVFENVSMEESDFGGE